MIAADILPWQLPEWQRLDQQISDGRLPHALLLAGPAESGKKRFADALCRRLLCEQPDQVCGVCSQCRLIAAGTHPDLLEVTLEDSKQIKVDQIRDLSAWAWQTASQGGYKVCIINPAHALNVQGANALLKSLEEPPAKTVICLVSDQPARLLATLRSRCQRINCVIPGKHESLEWLRSQCEPATHVELLLEMAGGVPLRALSIMDEDFLSLRRQLADLLLPLSDGSGSPLAAAAKLAKADPNAVADILYQLIADSISYTQTRQQQLRNSDLSEVLVSFAAKSSLDLRYELLDRVTSAKRSLSGTSNANPQMLLEWIFLKMA